MVQSRHHDAPAAYHKVFDSRNRRIRGLWRRNGRFYAQLACEEGATGQKRVRRVALEDVNTVPQAAAKLQDLLKLRRDKALPMFKRAPKFADYAAEYFRYYEAAKDAKRPSTIKTEKVAVRHWIEHLGHARLDQITRAMINGYIARRQAAGKAGRTVNLEVTILRNVLNRAVQDNWLKTLPTENLRPLKWTPRKRGLITEEEVEKLCAASLRASKNGREFSDYVRLMAFCGARKAETLRLQWADVSFERKQLTIGSDGLAKNHKSRVVDFNAKLEALLRDMFSRRAPDSKWLFPSPRRGDQDKPAKSFVETLRLARSEAGMAGFGFHDARHFFISNCVMSGIDYMTIARWAGHQDGGILIGKVYGHLSDEHARRMARRLAFAGAGEPAHA